MSIAWRTSVILYILRISHYFSQNFHFLPSVSNNCRSLKTKYFSYSWLSQRINCYHYSWWTYYTNFRVFRVFSLLEYLVQHWGNFVSLPTYQWQTVKLQLYPYFSSLSTGLNSMAAVVLEDFIKPFKKTPFSPKAVDILLKLMVVTLGVTCVGLVFVVEKTGSHVLQV